MDNLLDSKNLKKYLLVDTNKEPHNATLSVVQLTEHEASVKNFAFKINKSPKKYIKASEQ